MEKEKEKETVPLEDEKKETIVRKEVPNDIYDAFKRQKFEQRKSPKYDRKSPRPSREDRKSVDPNQVTQVDLSGMDSPRDDIIGSTRPRRESHISRDIYSHEKKNNLDIPTIVEEDHSHRITPRTSKVKNQGEKNQRDSSSSPRNSDKRPDGDRKSPRGKEDENYALFATNLDTVINLELNLGGLKYSIVKIFQPEFACRCITKWFFNTSSYFVSGSIDGFLSVFDADSQKVTLAFKAHQLGGLVDFSFSSTPNDLVVTTSAIERCVNVYQISKKSLVSEIHVDVGVTCVCWNSQQTHTDQNLHNFPKFITGNENGKLNVYFGYMSKEECYEIDYPRSFFGNNSDISSPITCLDVIVDSNSNFWICAGNLAGRISIFKYSDGTFSYSTHISLFAKITSIQYNLKKSSILVNCDNKLKVFSFPSLELTKIIFHQQQSNFSKSFLTLDGTSIITGSDNGSLTVYNVETGELRQSITIYPKISDSKVATLSVNTSEDGRYLTTTSSEGLIYLWQGY